MTFTEACAQTDRIVAAARERAKATYPDNVTLQYAAVCGALQSALAFSLAGMPVVP